MLTQHLPYFLTAHDLLFLQQPGNGIECRPQFFENRARTAMGTTQPSTLLSQWV